MFNKLIGTKQNLLDFVKNNHLKESDLPQITQCTNCDIWHPTKELITDLDENLICRVCERFYGL